MSTEQSSTPKNTKPVLQRQESIPDVPVDPKYASNRARKINPWEKKTDQESSTRLTKLTRKFSQNSLQKTKELNRNRNHSRSKLSLVQEAAQVLPEQKPQEQQPAKVEEEQPTKVEEEQEPAHVEPKIVDIQAAWSAKDDENGCTLVHFENFPSNHILDRHIEVFLPASYGNVDENKNGKRYPVLYMHDGQNCFDPATSFGGADWRVGKTVARLAAIKQIPEMIVVGVWNTHRRIPEYLPERPFRKLQEENSERSNGIVARFREKYNRYNPEEEDPCSDSYLKSLVTEVKPFIDDAFRTLPEQKHTSIMGSSMGGLISCYALCEYPDVFSAAGCVSTHWPIIEGSIVDFLETAEEHGIPSPSNHKFYFDFGTNSPDDEYEKFQERVDRVMEKKGYKWTETFFTEKFEGDDHSEMCWRNRLFLPLLFLFGNNNPSSQQ